MAILFADSLDLGGTTANILKRWTAADFKTSSLVSGRIAGSALNIQAIFSGFAYIQKTIADTTTLGISFAFRSVGVVGDTRAILKLLNTATIHVNLSLDATQRLTVVNGVGTILGTATEALVTGAWYHIEMLTTIADSGSVEVRLNGNSTPIINASGDTKNGSTTTINSFYFTNDSATSKIIEIDDVIVWDTTGPAPLNTFLGDTRIETIRPTGAGTTTGWTPNTGANHAAVDDTTPDDDTTYVSTGVSTTIDTYATGNLVGVPGTVYAVQPVLLARKTDAGVADIKAVVRTNGTDYSGSALSPSTSYLYLTELLPLNPDTGVAWTASDIDGAEFGVEFS